MRTKIILPIAAVSFLLMSFMFHPSADTEAAHKGMLKVTIFYPNAEGSTFDMDYYATKHMPMVADLLGDALVKFEIDKGISGRSPEEQAPYMAIGYLYVNSMEQYGQAFGPNADKIRGDIPNYTNVQPIIQVSEMVSK